jgi:hypothetical protein
MRKVLNLTERICAECDELKPIDDYYKNGKTSYFKKCKKCMCKVRRPNAYVPKPRQRSYILKKYDILSDEIKEALKKQREMLVPLTCIGRMYNFPLHWLRKWKSEGLI